MISAILLIRGLLRVVVRVIVVNVFNLTVLTVKRVNVAIRLNFEIVLLIIMIVLES